MYNLYTWHEGMLSKGNWGVCVLFEHGTPRIHLMSMGKVAENLQAN